MLSQWSNCSSSTIKFISSVKKSIYHDKHFICTINILWLSLNKSNTLLNRNEKSPQCLLKIIVRVNSIFTFYNPIFLGHFRPPPPVKSDIIYLCTLPSSKSQINLSTYLSSGQISHTSVICTFQFDKIFSLKFKYPEKATKFCENFTLLLTGTT